jgi:hypothetical protein
VSTSFAEISRLLHDRVQQAGSCEAEVFDTPIRLPDWNDLESDAAVGPDYRNDNGAGVSADEWRNLLVANSEAARRRAEFAICLRRARRRRRRFGSDSMLDVRRA